MAQYQVDSEQIRSSSAAVQASVGQIRQAVAGMYANLDALQGVWRGAAASRFASLATQWRASQQQMETALEAMQQALTQASTLYSDAESSAARLFAG
ncbi:WXG100 family type VII secretion target [Bifidobacterium platyrrhinorum]|uniref:ESAT-6-like protein n=1 Tax=Bifidobacterium platyrrhinorum TaxID=2661628 RepID=A0A6L9SP62_9BIFI|nr:WXG100 family type VII secretion target [Bifidobacterium platyrrhinorum]NEG54326.1 WXG100 family type VII secretion target [Bifidobacterium platyrrhinorum]